MLIGYARCSTQDQSLDLQLDSLKAAGCQKIFTDKVSGTISDRPGLNKLREQLRPGDTLVVWRLDRWARSLKHLIEWMSYLESEGVNFRSLHENIDTSTPAGRLTFHLFSALSEFESSLNRQRTRAGLEAARARGRMGGRPKALNKDKRELAISLYNEKKLSVQKVCEMMSISKPTLYKYLKAELK